MSAWAFDKEIILGGRRCVSIGRPQRGSMDSELELPALVLSGRDCGPADSRGTQIDLLQISKTMPVLDIFPVLW